jgi:hypothetical protein
MSYQNENEAKEEVTKPLMHSSWKSMGVPWGFGKIIFIGLFGLSENLQFF